MKHKLSRILSWLLVIALAFTVIPTVAFADPAATTTWTKVAFNEIAATDTIAITMSKDGTACVLPTTATGTSEQPMAAIATVSGNTLTTEGTSAAYGWSISATEGGYYIKTGENYLYITATNNGVRIGATAAVWTLIDDGYLASVDSAEAIRYLGVYNQLDWRCYKAYLTGNIAGQTLEFWKLGAGGTPVDPPVDPPVEPPVDPPVDPDTVTAELLTELEDGAKVYIYNPKNAKVMTSTVSGAVLAATDGVLEQELLTVTEEMAELSVSVDENNYYSFQNASGEYLTADAAANVLSFAPAASDYSLWNVEATEGGFFIKNATAKSGDTPIALEYYKNNFTAYTFQSYNTGAFVLQFFTTGAGGFTDTLKTGDQVLVYNPTHSMALSTTLVSAGNGFEGTELTLAADDTLSGYTDADIWSVTANGNDTYTFSTADGKKLSASGISLMLGGENFDWRTEAVPDKAGHFYLRSTVGPAIYWNAEKNTWSAFYSTNPEQYALRFYVVSGSTQPSNVVAAPKATPAAGEVNSGTEISFSCKTEGAAISYRIGNGEWTAYDAPIAITEDTTFTVKATKVGMEDSKEVTYAYTIYVAPELGANQAQLVTDASTLKSGDRILIVTKDYDYALGTAQKTNNRDQAPVIKAYDKLSYDEYAQILTLESGVEAGTFALYATNGDNKGYLYASEESGNLLRTQETKDLNASFTISIADTAEATIQSKLDKKANIIQYNTVGIFSCYGGTQKKVVIYKLIDAVEDPITDDMVQDGVLTLDRLTAGNATLIGQVVYHYGTSGTPDTVILEDIIGNQIYGFSVKADCAAYHVGDVVTVSGTIADNNGVLQMTNPSMSVVASGLTPIAAQDITVSELGTAYLSEYVHLTDVTLGSFNAAGNTAVTDTTGTANLFCGAPLPAGTAAADIAGLYGCCTTDGSAYLLRNGTSSDYRTAEEEAGMIQEGDVVVIYNLSAKGVLSGQDDNEQSPNINVAAASIQNDKAVCSNGAVLFTVERNGEYYRFHNETFGYLCANGTGNNAFYAVTASEDADWTVSAYNGGYRLGSRTAVFSGNTQYLQYFAGAFTSYGMATVTDMDIFTFYFYPCSSDKITDGVVNDPQAVFGTLSAAYAGQDYLLHFTVDALFGVKELTVRQGDTVLDYTVSGNRYTATVPAKLIVGESLPVTVSGLDNKGVVINTTVQIPVKDEPVISNVSPVANAQTKENKRPEISAVLTNVGENPTVTMSVNGENVSAVYANGKVSYTPAADMADGRVTVTVTVTRLDEKTVSKTWSFIIGESNYQLYFGQLHAHTGEYSDGNGTLADGLDYIKNLPESANVDFVAFTDHSNYFDKSGEANPEGALYDMTLATAYSQETWARYKTAIADFNASQSDVVALGGFEMTWSGGPGHINTFSTPGIVSRNNTTLNSKTSDAGMRSYYALLSRDEGAASISQFNHPGSQFGNFSNFSYWDAQTDNRVYLVEVGNGEGQIGAGGYYPSYEQYTLALDKGWHLSPTNNQDNHKAKWGNANDARDVVLTEDFTEEGIYDAIRNYRVYATEDKNLEILYSVNDLPMGTIIESVPGKLSFDISVMDPDSTDAIAKVELIVNSGKVAYTWDDDASLASGIFTAELNPEYSYYYVRVTQADGDLAVTAPVWVGSSLMLGISSVTCDTALPVTGEELKLSTTLYNSEASDALIKSITYTTNGSQVLGVDTTPRTVAAGSTLSIDWAYTPTLAKLTTITATVVLELESKEYTFSTSIELDIMDASKLVYIGIDASHYNEYAAGYNKALLNNFAALAAGSAVRTVELTTSEALIAACENKDGKFKAIVLTAPSRRLPAAISDPKVYSAAELTALTAFHANGGALLLSGWGDSNETGATGAHMAATQNSVLQAIGSALRLADDGTYDADAFALSLNTFGSNALTEGLTEQTLFSHYGGSSVYAVDAAGNAAAQLPETVSAVVFANPATISKDSDGDGLGGESTTKYLYADGDSRLLAMAMEQQSGKGLVVVAGTAFFNDYDLPAPDAADAASNANYLIAANLLNAIKPLGITDISEVKAQTEAGYKYTIEGVVTSNASGYDKDTAFFDCIYVQDATGGICCFPVAGEYKLGDRVRISGTSDFFQGEAELQVLTIEKLGEADPVKPVVITAEALNSRSAEGSLVTIKGTVTEITENNGVVESIYVKDEAGKIARVFIDGYITNSLKIENLEVGCLIEATGLASYDDTYAIKHDSYARIRVRNRAEIVCKAAPVPPPAEFPFKDVPEGKWYREAIEYVYNNKLMNGMGLTSFEPETTLTRAQLVTVLYRMAGSPAVSKAAPFTDVVSGKWFSDAIAWAYANGIANGMTATEFKPDLPSSREQTVTFLYRFAKLMKLDTSVSGDLSKYADVGTVSKYAVEAMTWAVSNGIVNGVGKNLLAPKDTTTRAQTAQLITRLHKLLP